VIEDLDGGDHGPSRAALVRGVSVALAFAALLGWAALSSPALRGPYATPDPLTALAAPAVTARYTPEPIKLINPAVSVIWISCAPRGLVYTTTVFVNGQPVSVNAQDGQVIGVTGPNGQSVGVNVPVPLAPSLRSYCLVPEPSIPFDRFAR
jgi:hypothetical protein